MSVEDVSMSTADISMRTAESWDPRVDEVVNNVIANQPRYIGVYAPGDFKVSTFRVVLPYDEYTRPGRGFRGAREEIMIESPGRFHVELLLRQLEGLIGSPSGPLAIRHILNPSTSRDEGIRLIWPRDGALGDAEMADWPRRDALIREGKTVRAVEAGDMQRGASRWISTPIGERLGMTAGAHDAMEEEMIAPIPNMVDLGPTWPFCPSPIEGEDVGMEDSIMAEA